MKSNLQLNISLFRKQFWHVIYSSSNDRCVLAPCFLYDALIEEPDSGRDNLFPPTLRFPHLSASAARTDPQTPVHSHRCCCLLFSHTSGYHSQVCDAEAAWWGPVGQRWVCEQIPAYFGGQMLGWLAAEGMLLSSQWNHWSASGNWSVTQVYKESFDE